VPGSGELFDVKGNFFGAATGPNRRHEVATRKRLEVRLGLGGDGTHRRIFRGEGVCSWGRGAWRYRMMIENPGAP
jgi:hypothetical protein